MKGDTIALNKLIARESEFFKKMTDALGKCRFETGTCRKVRLRRIVEALFTALENHEKVEQEVFETALGTWKREDVALQKHLSMQHHQLKALCKDILTIHGNAERYSDDHVRSLVELLRQNLSLHLEFEGMRFWAVIEEPDMVFPMSAMDDLKALEQAACSA